MLLDRPGERNVNNAICEVYRKSPAIKSTLTAMARLVTRAGHFIRKNPSRKSERTFRA
jgi:hypothetical protein